MKLSKLEKKLFMAISEMEIIDCHEHLPPEEERIKKPVDVFTLFSHYTHRDLVVAGMREEQYQSLYNQEMSLVARWKIFAPYWEQIRFGSYARAALLAAEKFYGFTDINEKTYQPLSEAIKKANKPGLYENVLRKACNIRTCLTQCGRTALGTPLLTPVMPMVYEMENWDSLTHLPFEKDAKISSLNDYLEAVTKYIIRVKNEGAVGLKMFSNPYGKPERGAAISLFEKLKSDSKLKLPVPNSLRDYVVDQSIKFAGENEMVVAVHTGYWGDFRQLDPLHMIPILQRYPEVRFDIYHLGYPWMRETLMLGKGFPNVWLNLCWTHIISQRFATAGLDEALDLIPVNKILAFGGDYCTPVEKVYGHLVMAREDVARVLAKRIEEGRINESQALNIAKRWFWENPKELYRLNF